MKKNLLFVIPGLGAGGGEKSLVNLLSLIDFNKFNVEIYLLSNEKGLNYHSLPKEVVHLALLNDHRIFTSRLLISIIGFIKARKYKLALTRIMFSVHNRLIKNNAFAEQQTWKYVSSSIQPLTKKYDVAIGYLEKSSVYFIVDKVCADKKIGWIHTNYDDSGMNKNYDYPYFKKLNYIVTVSEECAASLINNFNNLKTRIKVIYNIVSPSNVLFLARKKTNTTPFESDHINILTVARLSYEKGVDIAIESCHILVKKGYKIVWTVLGEGRERKKLQELIDNYGLGENFYLLGTKENPYPYFYDADIYVQPSRYEGKSIAIDEAKILKKPIVITNYNSAKDQINHGKNGLIVDVGKDGIAKGIENMISDNKQRDFFIKNLSQETLGTETEITKLYQLIDNGNV
ncbi:glycosyltransferase [Metabacillus idriensis]|uniref:glycosyltransferase n=1 Tax=Metabacillus idriensis TaxID=324768 RepID=UPI00174DA974|nr:glycosyltransferase [Metabacillus idriensis]